jgi:tRNA A-37 threonylcarbamoyl transferase component Bud32
MGEASNQKIVRNNLYEIDIIKFVESNTDIPVPKIIEIGEDYYKYEYIEGDTLEDVINDVDMSSICAQLKYYVDQMRNLKSADIRSIYSPINDEFAKADKSLSIKEFNSLISKNIRKTTSGYYTDYIQYMIKDDYSICFTHADLTPRNIIVKNNEVVGIIDWEMAGFYPEYWEYVKCSVVLWKSKWLKYINDILKPYPLEYGLFSIILQCTI